MKCRICNAESTPIHQATLMNKIQVQYFACPNCGFVQTEEPYWLEEAYSSAISSSDTGVLARNSFLAMVSTVILRTCCKKDARFLDFGGGYGIFTRLMRDLGFDFYWHDKYAANLVARGFEGSISNEKYAGVTAFENFEHFADPLAEIKTMLEITDFILFSTELVPDPVPAPSEWWYYCLEHGQHISLYSRKTLEQIARQNGLFLVTNGANLHILSRFPVSRHIFLIEKIVRRLGLSFILAGKSKTVSDMKKMIQNQKAEKS